jgi:putative acetyltransferase
MIEIRKEAPADHDWVRMLNDAAFGQPEEGRIVDLLRHSCPETLSLVAELDGQIVGHLFFSPATIGRRNGEIKGMGLAPMAVLPGFQNQGIGSTLVEEGIRRVRDMGYPFIIVLGHERYYPRFGFERASIHQLRCQWEGVPDEAFMVMILDGAVMKEVSGVVKYRDEFDQAMNQ